MASFSSYSIGQAKVSMSVDPETGAFCFHAESMLREEQVTVRVWQVVELDLGPDDEPEPSTVG